MLLRMCVMQMDVTAKFWMLCWICLGLGTGVGCERMCWNLHALSCGFFFSNETFILKVSFEVLDLQ